MHRLLAATMGESQQDRERICAIQALVIENEQGHHAKEEAAEQKKERR